MVREDLNPVEEARACAALVEELGLTKEELARRVGRSRPAVSNLIRLLELPDETLAAAGGRRAQRGPRPRPARGQRQRRPPPPRPRRGPRRLVGPRDREQGSAGWPAKGEAEASAGRSGAGGCAGGRRATRSRRRWATRCTVRAKGDGDRRRAALRRPRRGARAGPRAAPQRPADGAEAAAAPPLSSPAPGD